MSGEISLVPRLNVNDGMDARARAYIDQVRRRLALPVEEPVVEPVEQPVDIPSSVPFDIPSDLIERRRISLWKEILADTVVQAVQGIIPYLEDTSEANQVIYFDGWSGLAASAALRSIAEDTPLSLRKKFDKIIHVDCSRWKNRRALQKEIAYKLKLPQQVMAIFHRQDGEDDFSGVDVGSRVEIADVSREIHQALQGYSCLVVFHNGSQSAIDLNDFGIPKPGDRWSNVVSKVLWTFRGRLRPIPGMKPKMEQEHRDSKKKGSVKPVSSKKEESAKPEEQPLPEEVDSSHIYLYSNFNPGKSNWVDLLQEEAREIVLYAHQHGVPVEIATKCCLYVVSLNSKSGHRMDYDWTTHASNYWVCDGIIQAGNEDEAWEASVALHQEMQLEGYSYNRLPSIGDEFQTPGNWASLTYSNSEARTHIGALNLQAESTSFFLAVGSGSDHPITSLPNNMFQQSDKLRVLKLCRCTFSFSSPPFRRCHNLRFLGLDNCKDQPQKEEEEEQDRPAMEIFQSLWVLDICYTDWELALSPEIIEQIATNIREIHIKKGRIWHSNLAWRGLQNLRKLRVIEPTSPWETGHLPSLSGATGLRSLVLYGCVGLKHVVPEGLPPSLESFSLDAGSGVKDEAKLSKISLAGCVHLENFILRGRLPHFEELDVSCTSIRKLDLSDEVVQVPSLERVFLMGCRQLHAILWWKERRQLKMLRIDTKGKEDRRLQYSDPSPTPYIQYRKYDGYVVLGDGRFIQSLLLGGTTYLTSSLYLNLHMTASSSKVEGRGSRKGERDPYNNQVVGPYNDTLMERIAAADGIPSPPLPLDHHVQIGEGISLTDVKRDVVIEFVESIYSLHVHDNSSITSVTPKSVREGSHSVQLPLNLHMTASSSKAEGDRDPYNDQIVGTYSGTLMERIAAADGIPSPPPPLDRHVEIAEGISLTDVEGGKAIEAVESLMLSIDSLHVHDNSSITSVTPKSVREGYHSVQLHLKWCSIERCPKLETVFVSYDSGKVYSFDELEVILVSDLLTASCIWSKGIIAKVQGWRPFRNLQKIHLHSCPSLKFVLPLSTWFNLPSLEIIHIINCGDLRQIFPFDSSDEQAADSEKDTKDFPKLKHIHLQELPSLQQICGFKMYAPALQTIKLRGCWSLRRLPAVDRRRGEGRPAVDCEKDWWEKLEWDGLDAGHHPSLFEPRHSPYYKKALPRVSVLR